MSPIKLRNNRIVAGQAGFTLVELAVTLILVTIVTGAAFLVLNGGAKAKRVGDSVAEAQQNGRSAMNLILGDLRSAGYAVNTDEDLPIDTASEYRITVSMDRNRDGDIGPGERITYFLDNDQGQALAANTQNPFDYVLRRAVSDTTDTLATPVSGGGDVVAYLVTQRSSDDATYKDMPIFQYFDDAGAEMVGAVTDPAGSEFGLTLSDEQLGKPAGTGELQIEAIQVNIITESATPSNEGAHSYRRFSMSSQLSPRNFRYGSIGDLAYNAEEDPDPNDTTTVPPPDTTTTEPPPEEEEPVIPDYEPPIHITTARVLSMDVADLGEKDSEEGSATTEDYQDDIDLVLGTNPGVGNNMAIWFNGQPGKYAAGTLYDNSPNYYGTTSFDLNAIEIADLDFSGSDHPDAAAAVSVSSTTGGFQVWMNQSTSGTPGYLGSGASTTGPSVFYSQGSGSGNSILLVDFDNDGDNDVVLGTRTGAKVGEIEFWENIGSVFDHLGTYTASGEVLSLVAVDVNRDGYKDIVAGTNTHSSYRAGRLDLLKNNGNQTFSMVGSYATGAVYSLSSGDLNNDGYEDVIAGTRDGQNTGKVEFWANTGTGLYEADEASADGYVLSLDVGTLNYGDGVPDVVAGTHRESVQAWWTNLDSGDDVLPTYESWADAAAGGKVHVVRIAKIEYGAAEAWRDLLNDIVIGTEVSATAGEIVLYLNPWVWTLQN